MEISNGAVIGLATAALMVIAGVIALAAADRDHREHWTVRAQERSRRVPLMSHPIVGILGAGDDGELYVPLGTVDGEPWWYGHLNLRRPSHWLPYLRSRITRRVIWIELCGGDR